MADIYTLVKGVDKLYYALVTQDDLNGYVAGTPKQLAPLQLAVQTPETNSKTSYYDNQPMFNDVSKGATKLKLDITSLPLTIQAELLGNVYDATTESMYENGGTPPNIALGFRAKNSDGTYTLVWYYKATCAPYEEQAKSESDTPEPQGVQIEITAVRTVYQFVQSASVTDSAKRRISRKQADVATWFDAVKVPVNSAAPSLTLTANPANNATGVAVGVAPTLAFSNQLVTGTDGVVLMKSDGTLPTCTLAINTALKVITITPGSNLTAAGVYYIIISDVKDIYGQKYADTTIKFTCA